MRRGPQQKLMLVQPSKTEEAKAIFQLGELLYLFVMIESPRRVVRQCHPDRGTGTRKYVKCPGGHYTGLCGKIKVVAVRTLPTTRDAHGNPRLKRPHLWSSGWCRETSPTRRLSGKSTRASRRVDPPKNVPPATSTVPGGADVPVASQRSTDSNSRTAASNHAKSTTSNTVVEIESFLPGRCVDAPDCCDPGGVNAFTGVSSSHHEIAFHSDL